jgi:hypothetical protein
MAETYETEEAWAHIKPVLDEALDSLKARDREAVLLRFFRGATPAQVGQALGLSENAATQCVSRAVDRLRRYFTDRRIALPLPTLVAILSSRVIEVTAAEFAASCASVAMAAVQGVGAATQAAAIAHEAGRAMLGAQVKTVLGVTCAMVAVTGAAVSSVVHVPDIGAPPPPPLEQPEIRTFPLVYEARSVLPDGTIEFQLNSTEKTKTYFARLGEQVEGFTLIRHDIKTEEKRVQGLPGQRTVDVSELTLEKDGASVVLVKGKMIQKPSPAAEAQR